MRVDNTITTVLAAITVVVMLLKVRRLREIGGALKAKLRRR